MYSATDSREALSRLENPSRAPRPASYSPRLACAVDLAAQATRPFARHGRRIPHDCAAGLFRDETIGSHLDNLKLAKACGMASKREKVRLQVPPSVNGSSEAKASGNEAILRLARLIGRQMAREAFEAEARRSGLDDRPA